jgi:hypothetical protein
MNPLSASLNFNFASSEAQRIAQAERGAQEVIANQLRQAAASAPFAPGTTVTARYQYRVADDGSLVPLQTQISTNVQPDDSRLGDRRSGRFSQRNSNERAPSLADLVQPRASLSPTDEVALFAVRSSAGQTRAQVLEQSPARLSTPIARTQVLDENGDSVEAEVITLPTRGEDQRVARAQSAVAGLYARNNDIVYNVTPISRLAA